MSKNVQWRDKNGNICCGVKPEPIVKTKEKEQPTKKVNKTTKKG